MMHMKNNQNNQKGFILIEILAAVTIFGLMFLPVAHLFFYNIRTTVHCNELSIATSLAQDKIERLKSLSKDELKLIENKDIVEEIDYKNNTYERFSHVIEENMLFTLEVKVHTKGGEAHIVTYIFKE